MRRISEAVQGLFSDGKHLYFKESKGAGKDAGYVRIIDGERETITRETYFAGLYGEKCRFIMHYVKEKPAAASFGGDGSLFVCAHQEAVIYKFDRHGSLVRKYHEMGKLGGIQDIAVQGESIWCVYPEGHAVRRFSLTDGKEELVLARGQSGGGEETGFTFPQSLFLQADALFISDMGNHRVARTDLPTMRTESYLELPEPVCGYARVGDMEYVHLQSGLYALQPGHGKG